MVDRSENERNEFLFQMRLAALSILTTLLDGSKQFLMAAEDGWARRAGTINLLIWITILNQFLRIIRVNIVINDCL